MTRTTRYSTAQPGSRTAARRTALAVLALLCTLATAAAQDFFGGAQWIGATDGRTGGPASRRSITLRHAFRPLKAVSKAEVRICGLGLYEMTINDVPVSSAVLTPHRSDYSKRVFFDVYDVTSQIEQRTNELRVTLGGGYYHEPGLRYHPATPDYGAPTLLFLLYVTYADDTRERLVSNDTWQWTPSPLTYNSIFGGEDYDARLLPIPEEHPGQVWRPAVVQQGPQGTLTPAMEPASTVAGQYAVSKVLLLQQGRKGRGTIVFDMGRQLTGVPLISVKGKAGQRLTITPASELTADRHCRQDADASPFSWSYTLRGDADGELWRPAFSYYAFRYLQVEGDVGVLKEIQACDVHHDARRTGHFECSSQRLNDAHRRAVARMTDNWQDTWNDNATSGKAAATEQLWTGAEGLLYNYDARAAMAHVMTLIADAQQADGAVPAIVGEATARAKGHDGAVVALPMACWLHYGDLALARQHYGAMARYLDFLATRQGEQTFTDCALHYQWACYLYLLAKHLGHKDDAARYSATADDIRKLLNRRFYHAGRRQYGNGTAAEAAMALYLELVPESDRQAVLAQLTAQLRSTDGTAMSRMEAHYLMEALVKYDQHELACRLLGSDAASVERLLIPEVAGIRRNGDMTEICPHPVDGLTWCRASTESAHGQVTVAWRHEGGRFTLDIDMPEGGFADVYMPYSDHAESIGGGHHHLEEDDTTPHAPQKKKH